MPMNADEAIEVIRIYEASEFGAMGNPYDHDVTHEEVSAAEAAIREAFDVAARARAELARLDEYVSRFGSQGADVRSERRDRDLLRRIIDGEGS